MNSIARLPGPPLGLGDASGNSFFCNLLCILKCTARQSRDISLCYSTYVCTLLSSTTAASESALQTHSLRISYCHVLCDMLLVVCKLTSVACVYSGCALCVVFAPTFSTPSIICVLSNILLRLSVLRVPAQDHSKRKINLTHDS